MTACSSIVHCSVSARQDSSSCASTPMSVHHMPHVAALGLRSGFGDDLLRLGHVKFFIDGSLGAQRRGCWPPLHRKNLANLKQRPGGDIARRIGGRLPPGHGTWLPVSVHAIGDRANRVVLDIFEELADARAGDGDAAPHEAPYGPSTWAICTARQAWHHRQRTAFARSR